MATFPRTLALDVGASAVRLLEVGPDSRSRPAILAISEEPVAFDPAKSSEIFLPYSQAIAAAMPRLGTKTRQCHLCLGGPAVFARILKVPAGDPAKVRSIIGFEAQQTVPAIEQALWDFQLMASSQVGEFEALILAIKKETVEEISAAAVSAGLKPISATLAPAALLNSFQFNYPEAPGCHLILEMGARATTILLVEGSRFFVRVVPLGGAAITQAVATDLQESFVGAEVLKKAKGFVHPGGAYEDPADAATARISKLARGVMTRLHTEVERSVTFFRSQQGGGKPTHAWLCGGGAMMAYTDLFFREKLRLPVDYFQPFRRFPPSAQPEFQAATRNFSAWAVTVGTVFQGFADSPMRINVLGATGQELAKKKQDLPAMVVGAVAGAGLLFLPGIHGLWEAAKTGNQLASQAARVAEANAALEKLEAENKRFLGSVEQAEFALKLERERMRWPQLLEELRKHTPKKLWVSTLQVTPPAESPGAETSGGKAGETNPPIIEIQGMFETESEKADAEAVASFQKSLEAGGVLRKVEVLERETPLYVNGKADQVALKFRLKAEWPLEMITATPTPEGAK